MQRLSFLSVLICFFSVLAIGQKVSFCQETVLDWGSDEAGYGYEVIAKWLVENGYYSSLDEARAFAETGSIGYQDNFATPFYWKIKQPIEVTIVQERAVFADQNRLGYYTGGGSFKTLTEILSGSEIGPKTLTISRPFGFYLSTPQNNIWFTDRGENDVQSGPSRRKGGIPQALIYELKQGKEWLVAWEDLDATTLDSDRDYNDMYVKVTTVAGPIRGRLLLFLFLLLGAGALIASRIRRGAGRKG
ncbi:MAG: hypothetical protein V1923_03140 [Candidatus Omnitrophota bacterium]